MTSERQDGQSLTQRLRQAVVTLTDAEARLREREQASEEASKAAREALRRQTDSAGEPSRQLLAEVRSIQAASRDLLEKAGVHLPAPAQKPADGLRQSRQTTAGEPTKRLEACLAKARAKADKLPLLLAELRMAWEADQRRMSRRKLYGVAGAAAISVGIFAGVALLSYQSNNAAGEAAVQRLVEGLPVQYEGAIKGNSAVFVWSRKKSGDGLVGCVWYLGVKEDLDVAVKSELGNLVLTLKGRAYRRYDGMPNAGFSLDTFTGALASDFSAIAGDYVDTAGHRGSWQAQKQGGPEEQASIEVHSNVSGDLAKVDGNALGPTPQTVKVTIGEHVLEVGKEGCGVATQTVILAAGDREIAWLNPSCGSGRT
jgi:hypothetical protein